MINRWENQGSLSYMLSGSRHIGDKELVKKKGGLWVTVCKNGVQKFKIQTLFLAPEGNWVVTP